MQKWIGSLVLAAALALPADAENTSVDYSDLWWNPAHSGWGLGLQRQGEVMFATLFVYGSDGTATWLSASDVRATNAAQTSWSGKLYRTRGTAFSSRFDSSSVTIAEVGTLAVDFTGSKGGTLTYSVDGNRVVEPIERITFRAPSVAGSYQGGISAVSSMCNDDALDGEFDMTGSLTASQNGSRVAIAFNTPTLSGLPSSCNFTGDYSQSGRLGKVQGTWKCSLYWALDPRGESALYITRLGDFTLDEVAVTTNGFAGKLSANDQDCSIDGHIGGVRAP